MALTDAEKKELAALEAELGQKSATQGLTPQEQSEMAALESELAPKAPAQAPVPVPQEAIPAAIQEFLSEHPLVAKGAGMAAKALDYTSGLGRTAAALAADPFMKEELLKKGEGFKALTGEAVPGEELLKRAGVEEMGSVHVPGMGDVTGRDVAGAVGEIATDPLTYVSLGVIPAGKMLYKSGLKNIDKALSKKGVAPVSDVLMKEKIWGTTKGIQGKAKALEESLNARRARILEAADKMGAKADPLMASKGAAEEIARIKRDPGLRPMAEQLEGKLQSYIAEGPQTLTQMNEWKSNLYNTMPATAFDKYGKLLPPAKKFEKKLASGFKTEIEKGASSASAGAGEQLAKTNRDLGSLIAAKKPMAQQVDRAATQNVLSSVDAGIGGYAIHNPVQGGAILGLKKLGDLSKTTAFRTGAGLAIDNPILRSAYLAGQVIKNPWLNMSVRDENGY